MPEPRSRRIHGAAASCSKVTGPRANGEVGAASAKKAGFFAAGVYDPFSGSDPARMAEVCDRYERDLGGYLADFAGRN